jgi:hypothetical protein
MAASGSDLSLTPLSSEEAGDYTVSVDITYLGETETL